MVRYGERISIEDCIRVGKGERVEAAPGVRERVERTRERLSRWVEEGRIMYGINTGFGKLASTRIPGDKLEELQENLVLSHASGTGNPLSPELVRMAMFIRLHALSLGYSGTRWEVIKLLEEMLNRGVVPVVPEKGSVGASGDLAPSAHMTLVLIGRGEAFYGNKRMPGKEALERAGLSPITLEEKEGLALLNGTHFLSAINAYAVHESLKLCDLADVALSVSLDAIEGNLSAFDPRIQELKGIEGQVRTAENVRRILEGSGVERGKRVQDPYSFRCAPQVHGAVRELVEFAKRNVEKEINAVTDNPLVFEDGVVSGGNFHGELMAFTADILRMALSELASISERRIYILMDPSFTSLSPFLAKESGLNSGFMIPHVLAAALVSENKILSHPCSVDTIPTSGGQEDHVSMGMGGCLTLLRVLENVRTVLAVEFLSGLQALDLAGRTSGGFVEKIRKMVREEIPVMERDREIYKDIEKMKELLEGIWREWENF